MKKSLLLNSVFLILFACINTVSAATWYWVGGAAGTLSTTTTTVLSSSLGGTASSVTLTTSDKVIFDGTNLGGGATIAVTVTAGSAISIGQLILQNNVNVTYAANSSSNNVTINGGAGSDFDVSNGSTFYLPGTASNISVTLSTGCTCSVSGTISLGTAGGGSSKIIGTDAGSLIFNNGSLCNINLSGTAGVYPFGNGTNSSVVFNNGSKLVHTKSDDIFGGTGKTIVVFQPGSTYEYNGSNGSYVSWVQSTTDRTYSNFAFNNTGGASFTPTQANITVDSLIFRSTMLGTVTVQNSSNQTLNIKGNLSNYCTNKAISWDPGGTNSVINFNGSSVQTLYNAAAAGNLNFGNTSSSRSIFINVISGSILNLGSTNMYTGNFQLTSRSGVSANYVFTVKSGAILDMGTSVISGASVTTGGTFTVESGGTIKTGHLSGLSTTAATGAVQTQVRNYNSGANYVFNGTTGSQVTGNFIASTAATANTVNNLTIDNTSGVIFNIAGGTVNVTGILYLTNGIFNTITNAATAVIPSAASVTRTNGWVYGNLQKYVSGATNFEVGDNLYYTNVSVGANTTPGLFTVTTHANGDHPNINTSTMDAAHSENTYWTLTNNTAVFSSGASLAFNYPNGDIDPGSTPTLFKLGNYNASTWTYPTPYTAAANSISVTGITLFGDFEAAEAGCGSVVTWKGTFSSDWNVAANWCGGVPTTSSDVIIPNVATTPLISTANAVAKTVTIDAGSSLGMSGIYNLTLSGNSFTNNGGTGGLVASSSTGAVIFTATTATVSGTTNFQNVTISNCGLDFGTGSTVNGTFKINSGGYVNNNHPPVYACASTLLYNTGGAYGRGSEWMSGVSAGQPGYPGSVQIGTTGTYFNFGTTTAGVCSSLTIDPGTTFDMGTSVNNALTVGSNVTENGTLKLSTGLGGDIYVGGNYIVGAAGAVTNNSRATFFNGASGTQTILKTGGGTVYFDYMIVNKASGDVQLTNTAGNLTNVQINSSTNNAGLYVLQLQSGNIDLNGQSFTLNGTVSNSTNIYTSGTGVRRIYTSSGTGSFNVTGTAGAGTQNLNVNRASGSSSLTFDANVTLATSVGVDFGPSGMTLINSILQINANGFCINNSPNYGSASFLIYNNGGGGFNRNVEWNSNVAGPGYPNNIIVQNNTPVTLDAYTFPAAGLGCTGYLDIKSGSSVSMGALSKNLSIGTDLTISGTLTLSSVSGGDLNVGGNWTRTGIFTQNNRNVTFNGSLDGTITAAGGQVFSFAYINKSVKTAKVTLADDVSITDEIGFTQGTFDLASKNTTIRSTATKTARVGQSDATNTVLSYSGTGRFIIERNVAALRSWRLLTAPINSGQFIKDAWMEGATPSTTSPSLFNSDPVPGYGTHISGPSPAVNGFDETPQNNYSIKYHNGSGWVGTGIQPASTDITSKPGWMLFIRGGRNYPILTTTTGTPAQTTTLRTKGKINIGTMPTITPSGFVVVGNPYASAVNFSNVTKSGPGDIYYIWDPLLNGYSYTQAVGGWITMTRSGSTSYTAVPSPVSPGIDLSTGRIESGAAIMINSANITSLNFKEADKSPLNALVFRPSLPVSQPPSLRTNLYSVNSDGNSVLLDGVMNIFDRGYKTEVDGADAIKLTNFGESLGIMEKDKLLAIDKRDLLSANDTIFFSLSQVKIKNYTYELIADRLSQNNLAGFMEDKYLGTETPVKLNGVTKIDFSTNSQQPASYARDRFRLVFKKAVRYTVVNAFILNRDISVDWSVEDEMNVKGYTIERSTDGINFSEGGSRLIVLKSIIDQPGNYNWIDATPEPGTYYYRVKAITDLGMEVYSDKMKVKIVKSSPALYVFPNPVTNGQIQLQLNSVPAGKYNSRLLTMNGQLINKDAITHPGGTATHIIRPVQALANGTYQLEVTGPDNKISVIKVMVRKN